MEQARKWLSNPGQDDKGLGQRAIALIVEEGRKVADGLPGVQKAEILQLCDEVDGLSRQLADLCARGQGNSPQAQEIARKLSQKLHELKERINQAVVNRVVEDFIDIVTPLKQFTEAVMVPEGTPNRDQNFADKAAALQQFSNRAVKTAKMVAVGKKKKRILYHTYLFTCIRAATGWYDSNQLTVKHGSKKDKQLQTRSCSNTV